MDLSEKKGLIKEVVTKYLTEGAEALMERLGATAATKGKKKDHENKQREQRDKFHESTSGS